MVLVPVGEDDGVDVVEPVLDDPEVGQDQVDARLLGLGEEHAAVDDQQPPGELQHGHVAADLARARRAP